MNPEYLVPPPDCHAVTDGETWEIHPKKLCKGAKIIRCSVCGEPATSIDPYFPYFAELNLWLQAEGSEQLSELDFESLVCQMRAAQKKYFRTRDRGVLEESKRLEREVDKYLDERQQGMGSD